MGLEVPVATDIGGEGWHFVDCCQRRNLEIVEVRQLFYQLFRLRARSLLEPMKYFSYVEDMNVEFVK